MTKTLLIAMGLGLASLGSGTMTAAEGTEPVKLYGVKYYTEADRASNGVYSVLAEPGAQPQLEWADGDMIASGGAVYTDDGMLYILTYMSFMGQEIWTYQMCDFASRTYDYLLSAEEPGKTELKALDPIYDSAATMTFDPTTNTIYAVTLADTTGKNFVLSTMSRENAKKTKVVNLPQRLFTLSFTADGQLYGIGEDGWLHKVNKYTGELTPVGDTGVKPDANQSAVIDYATNVMYWNAYTEEGGYLYSVDIATGEATMITKFEPTYQLYGLFIEQTAFKGEAPQTVTDLTPVFEGASLEGKLTFSLPTLSIDGSTLTGNVDYTVAESGAILAQGSGEPGSTVEANVSVPEAGFYRFVVSAEKAGENGPGVNLEIWVGPDTPKAVTDLLVSYEGETATASWTLPERGIHEGYVDHSLVRYQVVRGPENVMVNDSYEGTTFSETVIREGVYPVMYMVTPVYAGLVGESLIGNTVIAGTHFDPPCKLDMSDIFLTLCFNVEDTNADKATWVWSEDHYDMMCYWPISSDRKRNDWLITPAFRVEPGFDYVVNVEMRSDGFWNYEAQAYENVYAGELGVYLGDAQTSDSMTDTLLESEPVENFEWYYRCSPEQTFETEGLKYIGLHMTGGVEVRNIYNAHIKTIEITKTPTASVGELSADAFAVRGFEGGLQIYNPSSSTVRVVTLDGTVSAIVTESDATVSLPRGLYLVTNGSETRKVAVR